MCTKKNKTKKQKEKKKIKNKKKKNNKIKKAMPWICRKIYGTHTSPSQRIPHSKWKFGNGMEKKI